MLTLNLGGKEIWDPKKKVFVKTPDQFFNLEDSLYAVSQWESKWRKPWYDPSATNRSSDEFADYIQYMSLDGPIPLQLLTVDHMNEIKEYLETPHTATTIKNMGGSSSGGIVTSEVLYAQMAISGVDWEAQYWNIHRLQMTLRVISEMHSEKKKMPRSEILKTNAQLNAERKRQLNTKG